MQKKGQAALEYLMTYGWALIVIVIAVAALVLLLNPQSLRGQTCDARMGNFVISSETAIKSTGLDLVLTNNTGSETTNMDFTASGEFAATLADQNMTAGSTRTFSFAGTAAGDYEVTITMTYDTPNVTGHSVTGSCRGTMS